MPRPTRLLQRNEPLEGREPLGGRTPEGLGSSINLVKESTSLSQPSKSSPAWPKNSQTRGDPAP